MKARVAVIDPPWKYDFYGKQGVGRTPDAHYRVLTHDELLKLPIGDCLARDAMVFLWAVNPKLHHAIDLLRTWGLSYITKIEWVKMNRRAILQMGLGYRVRGMTEPLLIARKGDGLPVPKSGAIEGVILRPRTEHSAKPHIQYDIAEQYPGPYLEIFSRYDGGLFGKRAGWTFLGDAIDGRDIRDALRDYAAMPEIEASA